MASSPTRFDPIIQAVTRRTESIYTKMGIKRDESEDLGRKKRGQAEDDTKSITWEDTTEVSIQALRGFLEDLIGIGGESNPSPQQAAPQPTQQANSAAARAAHAYQSTGQIVHDKNIETPPIPHTPQQQTSESLARLGDDFGEEEIAVIRDYIRQMIALEMRGVTELTLRRSLTFLESIKLAIEDAK